MMIGWRTAVIAAAIGIAAFSFQSVRLHFSQLENERLERDLATCSGRAANMELRRGVEDRTANEPDPVGELRRGYTRPN
jgi:hypothetical protein